MVIRGRGQAVGVMLLAKLLGQFVDMTGTSSRDKRDLANKTDIV